MSRRTSQSVLPPPAPKKPRTIAEMRRGIERINERIVALQAFDASMMKVEEPPEIAGMQVDIKATLERILGEDTADYRRFDSACDLLWRSSIAFEGYPLLKDFQEEVNKKIVRSVAILGQVVRFLEEEIEDAAGDQSVPAARPASESSKVFVVHGHDEAALQSVARFLEQLRLDAIILREQPDQGRTIIEKFEDCANEVGFSVVLLTPEDLGGTMAATAQASRARQNVIFELGYFSGKLGRGRSCLLRKGAVEIPSDLYGVIYTEMDDADGWKLKLVKEMKAAKLDFDANRIWG